MGSACVRSAGIGGGCFDNGDDDEDDVDVDADSDVILGSVRRRCMAMLGLCCTSAGKLSGVSNAPASLSSLLSPTPPLEPSSYAPDRACRFF